MFETLFCFCFWIALYVFVIWLAVGWDFYAANIWGDIFYFVIELVVIFLVHTIGNSVFCDLYNEPVPKFVVSAVELPIQQLEYNGKSIDVVVVKNGRVGKLFQAYGDEKTKGLDVRRVSDIIEYTRTPETKIYLVKERGRFWWFFYILPRKVITDQVVVS